MKLVFCSSVYNMNDYDHLCQRSKGTLSLADHNLNFNIIIGLDEAMGAPISLINNVQIPSYPQYPKVFFRKQRWQHTDGAADYNCGFINLPVLKHISRAFTTFWGIQKAVKSAGDEDVCIMTYDVRLGIAIAISLARKVFSNVRTCIVLPDIPTEVLAASTGGKITLKAKLWAKLKMRFIRRFDSYVFVTESMKEIVDVTQKPYTVVEGIYNNHTPPLPEKTTDKKVIFYSGQLNPAYGMENLIDAFIAIYEHNRNYEFWVCGGGRLAQRISALAKECPGIKYFGYVGPEKVRQLQAQASVLVNPRQNIGGLTKFSFPSKTMEYLASGRPVVGYKLDGIPDEYDQYIQYVPDNSIGALYDKLIEVCEMSSEVTRAMGEKSRTFILEKKNPRSQCTRIVDVIKQLS